MVEEPNHTTARKPLHSINYSKLSGDVQYNEDLQLIEASLDPFPN